MGIAEMTAIQLNAELQDNVNGRFDSEVKEVKIHDGTE